MTETIKIVEPAFCVALYELEKKINEGYKLTQNVPIFIGGLYEIELEKEEKALDKVSFTKDQQGKLEEAGVVGVVVPVVDGEVSEEDVQKAVDIAAAPKRGRKPAGK